MDSKSSDPIDLEGEEDICYEDTGTREENEFDDLVGVMEEVITSDEFTTIQTGFCERHCGIFREDDENRPEYMEIFHEYTRIIENTIRTMMLERVPSFDMSKFEAMIEERPDEISGEIFDMLASMGDFVEFKDMMMNHKRQNSRSQRIDLSLNGTHVG